MPRLVTQAVSEQPVVALIGEASPLRSVLASFFERHEFSVAEFSKPSAFTSEKTAFYKVIFLDGWSRVSSVNQNDVDQQEMITALEHAISLSTTVFFIQEHVAATQTDAEYNRKKVRYVIETTVPEVHIVLGQDVLFDTNVWWGWQEITAEITAGILYSLDTVLYPISFKAFIRLLTPIILSPQHQLRSIIRGQEQPGEYITAEIARQYDLYHQKKLDIQQKKLTIDTSHEAGFTVVVPPTEALPTLLQEGIQTLPSPTTVLSEESEVLPLKKPEKSIFEQQAPKNVVANNQVVFTPSSALLPKVKQTAYQPTKPEKPQKTSEKQTDTKAPVSQDEGESVNQEKIIKKVAKNTTVDEQLSSLFSHKRTEEKVSKIKKKVSSKKKITTKNKKRSALFLGGVAVIGAAIGVLLLATVFWLNQVVLRNALFNQIENIENENQQLLLTSKKLLQLQTDSYETVVPAPFFDSAHEILELSDDWLLAQKRIEAFSTVQIDLYSN